MVREKYAEACRVGLTLYPINRPASDTVAARAICGLWGLDLDQPGRQRHLGPGVALISSPALRGRWLTTFGGHQTATLVFLQPGLRDRDAIL